MKARLRAEPVSLKTSNGSKKIVKELPMFEMVCPNKNIQKSTPNLFSLDVLAESGVERDRIMRRAMPMLLRLHVDSVHESRYTIQRDWLPLALFDGHRTMDNLAGHLRVGALQHKARSFPIRSKRAETTYRLPGYRFSLDCLGPVVRLLQRIS